MKHKEGFLFALLLLASSALAQTIDSQTTNDLPEKNLPKQVALARSAYTQTEEVIADGAPNDSKGDNTLAQIPGRMPGPMAGPPMRRAAYPNMWMSGGSPGHALIGALIGFGLGAAVCAKGNAGARATLALGTVGGDRRGYRLLDSVFPWPKHVPARVAGRRRGGLPIETRNKHA